MPNFTLTCNFGSFPTSLCLLGLEEDPECALGSVTDALVTAITSPPPPAGQMSPGRHSVSYLGPNTSPPPPEITETCSPWGQDSKQKQDRGQRSGG